LNSLLRCASGQKKQNEKNFARENKVIAFLTHLLPATHSKGAQERLNVDETLG